MMINYQITNEEKKAVVNYLSAKISANDTEIVNGWLEKSETNKLRIEFIIPKDQTSVDKTVTKPKLEIIESVEPVPLISWKDQRWVINNETSMVRIITQDNDYNSMRVTYYTFENKQL